MFHFENDRINTPPKVDEPDITKSPMQIPDRKDKFDNTDLRTVKELEVLSRTPDSGIQIPLEDQGREVDRGA